MFILNKQSKIIQECNNQDVIKICMNDSEGFAVAETREALMNPENASEKAANKAESKKNDKANEIAEAEKKAQEEANKATQEASDNAEEGAEVKTDSEGSEVVEDPDQKSMQEKYEAMNVESLRAIAKEKKIQGYGNMNKATLVAVIMAH